MKTLGQPTGHDSDHAGMPADPRQNQRRIGFRTKLCICLLCGCQKHGLIEFLPAGVAVVHHFGQFLGPGGVVRREQLDSQRSFSEPTVGIETRGQPIPHVLTLKHRFFIETQKLHQPPHAIATSLAETFEAMLHQNPVFVDERHDICHRAECCIAECP